MTGTRQCVSNRCNRPGFTLIEALVAMTILAGVAVISFQLLALLLRVDRQSMTSSSQLLAVDRLADRFRQDVHAAESIQWVNPVPGNSASFSQIDLTTNGNLVRYQATPDGILRLVPGSDLTHPRERDLFAVTDVTPEFVDAGAMVQLRLARRPVSGSSTHESLVIEAVMLKEVRP